MDGLILITTLLSMVFLIVFAISWFEFAKSKEEVRQHIFEISTYKQQRITSANKSFSKNIVNRIFHYADDFSSLGHRINFFSESHDIERLLMQAAYPYNLNVDRFQGTKIVLGIAGFIMGSLLFIIGFPFSQFGLIAFPLAGYMTLIIWLKSKAKARQEELGFVLPDFLDTVSVTLQAGVSLDQAIEEIAPYFDGPVNEEFSRYSQKIKLGVPREMAYRDLLTRNESPEFQLLIKSLIQGSQLGVPVSTTFKLQAEEMRKLKKEKIKEKAAKASPKITLVTTFILMPTAMFLIGGLMIMNMFMGENNMMDLFG
ncbi:type II secretion system F family protein [Salipaludibacillus daqingensis]|uniref:type II secretion system F family protein n=1 Tax=Salipaludibacillus daqingensis TaxID=3041001 RepID=UPI0024741FC0|nr:type II secretion system F family protein [Salipaludibacillus daqingensis]